jgi:hypothetical protein
MTDGPCVARRTTRLRPPAPGTANPFAIPVASYFEGGIRHSGALENRRFFGVGLYFLWIPRDPGSNTSLSGPTTRQRQPPRARARSRGNNSSPPSPPSRGRHPRRRRPPHRRAGEKAEPHLGPPQGPPPPLLLRHHTRLGSSRRIDFRRGRRSLDGEMGSPCMAAPPPPRGGGRGAGAGGRRDEEQGWADEEPWLVGRERGAHVDKV